MEYFTEKNEGYSIATSESLSTEDTYRFIVKNIRMQGNLPTI